MIEHNPATEQRSQRTIKPAARSHTRTSTSHGSVVKNPDKGHRGRPSRDTYEHKVASMVRKDAWALDTCSTFANYPGVRKLVAQHKRSLLPMGVALTLLIQRAVHDVIETTKIVPDSNLSRVGTFLRMWYCERQTVVAVARVLGLERTYVAKAVQKRALTLVAQRFLTLAEQVDPLN